MKLELNLNWSWLLHKIRILFILLGFWALYTYIGEIWGFLFLGYFILNDLLEIVLDIEKMKEEKEKAWKGLVSKRKGF